MDDRKGLRPIVFVWDNFGPGHADRTEAMAQATVCPVVGVELVSQSTDYPWKSDSRAAFRKITLSARPRAGLSIAWLLVRTLLGLRPIAVFFCHYERLEIFIAALICRVAGIRVLSMNDSKFDDYARVFWRELLKRIYFVPYHGAIAASRRSADYLRFLGVPERRLALGYDAVSVDRIRREAGSPPAPAGIPFADRHFTIVARLIPKKNIGLALRAFAIARKAGVKRQLVICGSGVLERGLKALAEDLGIGSAVDFRGFVDAAEVARTLASSLALIQPSHEEQFGQSIAEAVVMGVPVLTSDNCGARDSLVRTGMNGFIFEPDNVEGLAWLMGLIAGDQATWTRLSQGCGSFVQAAGLEPFVEGCSALLGSVPVLRKPDRVAPPAVDTPAPIALFAYKRPAQTMRALEHLSRCPEFDRSPLFVFIDGPKRASDRAAVEETIAVVKGFQAPNVTVVVQQENRGLAASIISGVTQICDEWGRVIVIEDDLVVHPTTLTWLNQGLTAYADDRRVMQIGAYQYNTPEFEERTYGTFQRFATTWGWATWKRAWDLFDPIACGWESVEARGPARLDFDAGGSYPFSDMLVRQMTGRLDSWGIRWSWTLHQHGGLSLLPPRTLVINEGFEDSATHNSVGRLKRFAMGPSPAPWTEAFPPDLPVAPMVVPWEQAVFRRGLVRTGARRNARIKRTLATLGLKRFL
ncbi:glycosyltransferase [Brevundimonas sp.]|uniref:glycosyltransferase n=1 Tax=Brevundimonas sp. TaxID=1871086 RepID=UPI0026127920|nr:glycosyltransferase [Brevundimonas sp.]